MAHFYENEGVTKVRGEVRSWQGLNAETEDQLLSIRRDEKGETKRCVNSREVKRFDDPLGKTLERRFFALLA